LITVFLADCLSKIDFTEEGPFGKMGLKLKRNLEIAQQEHYNSLLKNDEKNFFQNQDESNLDKTLIFSNSINNNYYNLRVPGS